MKKIFPFFLLVLLLASCQKDPDMSKLDNDFLVFTNHDKDAKFESFTTFYIPDSVLVIGTSEKPQFWTANEADDIITTLVNNGKPRFKRTLDKDNADLVCKFLTYKVLNISLTTTMATTTVLVVELSGILESGLLGTGLGKLVLPVSCSV